MPTLRENKELWERNYDWAQQGEEWSAPWGGSASQWRATLRPRINEFMPCHSVLEIAPGFGRWTQYLKELCDQLLVLDMSARCIEGCRERFRGSSHIRYAVNDGLSLEAVEDRSIDFVFSFDSLVHAEAKVLENYLSQLERKLTRHGVGFIHHSNAARYRTYFSLAARLPRGRRFLTERGFLINDCARALDMSAELFEEYCGRAGLRCIGQEIINWHGGALIDCISLFTLPGSKWDRPNQVVENRSFVAEAAIAKRLSPLYAASTPGRNSP